MTVVTRFAPRPPAFCISAARAPRCSTGFTHAAWRKMLPRDRGHRPRALDAGGDRGHSRRALLARHRLGRRGHLSTRARAARHREVAEQSLPPAMRIAAMLLPRSLRRCARRRGAKAARDSMTALARPRSERGAAGRQGGDPAGAARRRNRHRGSGPGPRGLAERELRRSRAAALRRHADLHARRRRRRPRHGRDSSSAATIT